LLAPFAASPQGNEFMKLKVALVSVAGLAIVSIAGLARVSFGADVSTSSAIATKVLSWYDDATPQIVENLQNATEALTSQDQQQLANTYNAAVVASAAKEKDDRTARAKNETFELRLPCVLKFEGKAEVGSITVSVSEIDFCKTSLIVAAIVYACKKDQQKLAECIETIHRIVKAHLEKEMKEAVAEPAEKGPNAEEKADLKGASRPPGEIRAADEEAARLEREIRGLKDPKPDFQPTDEFKRGIEFDR
jgi:hypothetical protein